MVTVVWSVVESAKSAAVRMGYWNGGLVTGFESHDSGYVSVSRSRERTCDRWGNLSLVCVQANLP